MVSTLPANRPKAFPVTQPSRLSAGGYNSLTGQGNVTYRAQALGLEQQQRQHQQQQPQQLEQTQKVEEEPQASEEQTEQKETASSGADIDIEDGAYQQQAQGRAWYAGVSSALFGHLGR
mmetsp:Transcript_39678/g.84820  ORF Transcript_39678/g.84820 Transcript_39678/m.84820 type:complete len:119 (+) Transcript_39678:139-495(+)